MSEKEYNKSYLLIDDFDNTESSTSCVAKRLSLSRRNFVNEHSNCSTHFYWRGMLLVLALSRFGDFCVHDDDDDTTNQLTPCTCMWANCYTPSLESSLQYMSA